MARLLTAIVAASVVLTMTGPSVAGSNMHGNRKSTSALKVPAGSAILLPNIRWAKGKEPKSNDGRIWRYTEDDKRDRGLAGSPNIQDHLEIFLTPSGRR